MAGSTNSISYLALGLANRGHQIYLGCRRESLLAELVKHSPVKVIPMVFRKKIDFQNAKEIARVVEEYHIEVVNPQSSWDRYTSGMARIFFGMKAPVIHTRRQMPKSSGFFFKTGFTEDFKKIVAVSQQGPKGFNTTGNKRKPY